jgi:two-component system cell cycle response regulator DivK
MAGELILIIEDNDKNLKLIRDVLQFNGYQTAEAMTAEDGLGLARSQPPALILLDIQLPGMDGFAALRQLRADPITKSIFVMAVTASALEQDRQKILKAGFDAYMTKPINTKQLMKEIRTALAGDRGMFGPRP